MKKFMGSLIFAFSIPMYLQSMEEGAGLFKEVERPLRFDDLDRKEQSAHSNLVIAISNEKVNLAKNLIAGVGRAINILDDGETLLHKAVNKNSPEIVELLVNYGANPNIKSRHGQTPLLNFLLNSALNKNPNPSIVKLLVNAGGDPKIDAGIYAPSITVFAANILADVKGKLEGSEEEKSNKREIMELLLAHDSNYKDQLKEKSIDEIVEAIVKPARDDDESSYDSDEEDFEEEEA